MLKLAEMEYTGATSVFIRVLLDKKYALPYRVIDSLVFHFLRYKIGFLVYTVSKFNKIADLQETLGSCLSCGTSPS